MSEFKGRHFRGEIVLWAVRWYCRYAASGKSDPFNTWVNQLHQQRGFTRATVAVANKNARIIWAVLRTGEVYHGAR